MEETATGTRCRVLYVRSDPYPLAVNRSLAQRIGLNEAILVSTVDYLLNRLQLGVAQPDGELWIEAGVRLLQLHLPWWSLDTINRVVKKCADAGWLVASTEFNKSPKDTTRWLRLGDALAPVRVEVRP